MNVQKQISTSYAPSFQAGLKISKLNAANMMTGEQASELVGLFKQIGTEADEFTLIIGGKFKDVMLIQGKLYEAEKYLMQLHAQINGIPLKEDFSQAEHTSLGGIKEEKMPYNIIKNWVMEVINQKRK